MPTILIAEGKQEVSSFNPVPSHYHDFDVSWGEEILAVHRGGQKEIGGALSVFDAHPEIELVPAYSFRAITSGGTLAANDFDRLADEFLRAVKTAPPVDGVYFSLHGAMAAVNEMDPEGYLLAETRRILGDSIPIVISLDLHGILTDRMLQHSDGLTVFHTYPHVDFFDTGVRAAKLLLKIMEEGVKPVIAKVDIPALVRGDELITETGLFGRSIRAAQAVERSPGGLAAGLFIGNPFTDVPDLRSNSLVITDNDPVLARREALKLATDFWQVREQLQAPLTRLDEAIQLAFETEGTLIFSDAADATSSGASGDSNAIMRELLAAGYQGRVLLPMVDPPAVKRAVAAGIGATIQTPIGGALDSGRFSPIPIAAKVRLLSDGEFINESHGSLWHSGETAVLETETMTIVTTSRPVSLYDRSLFLAHGQNPKNFDLVVVKSPHCQHRFFEAWAARLVNVDAPGSTSANLHSLGHTQCLRPIFPLDEVVPFDPQVKLFQRS